MSIFQKFDSEYGDVIINIETGESYASVLAYSEMGKKSRSAISDRLDDLEDDFMEDIPEKYKKGNKVYVQTQKGLRLCRLIPEKLITTWIIKDNPDLATVMLHAGTRLFLHKIAGFQFVAIAPQQNNDLLLSQVSQVATMLTNIQAQLEQSEARATKYLEDAEKHREIANQRLDTMYQMYPKYFRMCDIDPSLRKFPQLEKLLEEVSKELKNKPNQDFYPLKHYTKGYNLKHGEKISIGQDVSGWLKMSNDKMLRKLNQYQNSSNLYPECAKPLIDYAVKALKAKA